MAKDTKKYDVIVIGGGSGTKLIRPVAKIGLKVAVIEKDKMGGTCLNRGCIPSKMLIQSADVISWILRAKNFEIDAKIDQINFSKLVEQVNYTIDKEASEIPPSYEKIPNIDLYQKECKFISDKVIQVADEKITADYFFLAIGVRPKIPAIKGLKETPYLTSNEALRNTKKPKKLVIIGGGYIGCELGFFYQMMGSEVHILTDNGLLDKEDIDIQKEFYENFSKIVNVNLNCSVKEVAFKNSQFNVTFSQKEKRRSIISDALMVATGVEPWTDHIGLENTDIKLDDKGFIQVDEYLQTTQKNIWAFGDCIGRHLFRHTANYEGEHLFKTLFLEKEKKQLVYPPIPHAIFSFPRIGCVGIKEQELLDKKIPYVIGMNRYCDSARGMALRCSGGFVKLLFDKKNCKLIGAHCIGDEASNLVHMLIAYMKMNATIDDLLDTIYIHPTLPEIIRNAAKKAVKNWDKVNKESKKVDLTE